LARAPAPSAQVPADGFSDIFYAAKTGNVQHLTFFIEEVRMSANTKDEHGNSPLHWAALSNKTEAVQYLLTHGAELDLASEEGQRTWSACKNVEIRNLLLSTCRCSDHELYLQMAGVKPATRLMAQQPPAPSRVQLVAPQQRMVPAVARQLPAAGPQPQMQQRLSIPPIQAVPMPLVPPAPVFSQQPQMQQAGLVYYVVPPQDVERFVQTLRSQNANVVWVGDAPQQMMPAAHIFSQQPQQQEQQVMHQQHFFPMAPEQTVNPVLPFQMPQEQEMQPMPQQVPRRPVDLLM
jgi:hypothetical protein